MSFFLIISEPEKESHKLLLAMIGADERQSQGTWEDTASALRELAGQVVSRPKQWTAYEVGTIDDERLEMVAEAVAEKLREQGEAILDLETKLLTVSELQAVAEGMGLSIGLVAVLKPKPGPRPPLAAPLDRALIAAVRDLGGRASTGELAERVRLPKIQVRKRLQLLAKFQWLVSTGARGSRRYSLPEGKRAMTKVSNRGHVTPDRIGEMLECITSLLPKIDHIRACQPCLAAFTKALLEKSEELRPLVWTSQGLSLRTANALARAGLLSRRELKDRELESIPGVGKASAAEIRRMLAQPPLLP
jgi:hypothetical protein